MTGRRFTRSVLKDDTSTTTTAAGNNNDASMEVDTDNNHKPINNNRRTSPHRRSSDTSQTTNPILDDMSDIELDLSDTAIANDNNVRTISEEQVTANDEADIDMEIGKLDDDEQQWPSPPSNNATNSSNNDSSPTMATYQQQYYGGKSADNDKLKSYRISHLQHRISALESQVSSLSSNLPSSATTLNSTTNSSSTATKVLPAYQPAYQPMSQTEEERLKRRISEMEYELQMRRNRTNRLRKLIMDYVQLPSIVMPMEGEGVGLNGQQWEVYEQQFGMNVAEGANVVSPLVQQQQMNVNNGQVSGLDSLPELPVMNLNDNVEGSSEGQSGKKRGYAEV